MAGFGISGRIIDSALYSAGSKVKGFFIEDIKSLGNNPKMIVRCEKCNVSRECYLSVISAKSKEIRCWHCKPKPEFYSKKSSKYFGFYKLWHGINPKKRTKDFPSFFSFMESTILALGNAFRFDLNLKLLRYDTSFPHSFTNSYLILTHDDGKTEEFNYSKSKEIEA